MLADTHLAARRFSDAMGPARTAVTLDTNSVFARLTLARVLWATDRRSDARGMALTARALADTDAERRQVQSVIDFFDRVEQAPAATRPLPAAGGATNTPAATGTPGTAAAAPRVFLDLRPVGAGETRVLGTFQAIACGAGTVTLVFGTDAATVRVTARAVSEIAFVSFRTNAPGTVNCGVFPQPIRALLTYRAGPAPTAASAGTAVAVELVPDDFVLR
jgi:hypothetical protein